jgi:hypothetical protein
VASVKERIARELGESIALWIYTPSNIVKAENRKSKFVSVRPEPGITAVAVAIST